MGETADQFFVVLERWIVGHAPVGLQPILAALLSVVAILVVFASLFAITTILERKGLGRIDRKSTRLNSSHFQVSRMPSSA